MKQTGQEVIVRGESVPDVAQQPENMLAMIARAAENPNVDVAKMQALLNMKMQIDERNARAAFFAAMARLQQKLPTITKQGRIEVRGELRSTYARYEDIDEVVRPLMAEEGFAISYNSRQEGPQLFITARLVHEAGHSEQYEVRLPIDNSGSMNPTQGVGSTVTYGKRYLLTMALNIVTKGLDTDGVADEPINEDQVRNVETMMLHAQADPVKFLKFMDVRMVSEIKQSQYDKAMSALKTKAAKQQ